MKAVGHFCFGCLQCMVNVPILQPSSLRVQVELKFLNILLPWWECEPLTYGLTVWRANHLTGHD